jgi:drug/metabolite transporter (DMT)-like permease
MTETRMRPLAAAMVLAAVFMWATSFPLIKVGLEFMPPLTFAFIRYAIAACLMGAFILYRKGSRDMITEFRSDWKILTLVGIFGTALPNALLNIALQYTTASLSAIIQASGPVWTVVFAVILLKEFLGVDKLVGTVVAIVGTVFLVAQDGIDFSNLSFVGNLIVLGTPLSYAVSGVVTKVALRDHHPIDVTGWGLIVGSFLLMLTTPVEFGSTLNFSSEFLVIVVLLGIFPGCLAFLFYNYVLRTSEVSSLAFFIYLIPVFATLMSVFFLGETVTVATVFLAGVVILGVAIAQYRLVSRIRGVPVED